MLPRYALGNWWSRYYKYSEESYMELMDKFDEKNIPFTVAVIDMDWHQVDVDPKYGSGWTGYTWNKKLFPDPKRFLGKLHDRGMHTTLNVHPADGVQGCEEMYVDMAKEMGVDYEMRIRLYVIRQAQSLWMHILSIFIIRERLKVWISGGLTGSRAATARLKD